MPLVDADSSTPSTVQGVQGVQAAVHVAMLHVVSTALERMYIRGCHVDVQQPTRVCTPGSMPNMLTCDSDGGLGWRPHKAHAPRPTAHVRARSSACSISMREARIRSYPWR